MDVKRGKIERHDNATTTGFKLVFRTSGVVARGGHDKMRINHVIKTDQWRAAPQIRPAPLSRPSFVGKFCRQCRQYFFSITGVIISILSAGTMHAYRLTLYNLFAVIIGLP